MEKFHALNEFFLQRYKVNEWIDNEMLYRRTQISVFYQKEYVFDNFVTLGTYSFNKLFTIQKLEESYLISFSCTDTKIKH